VGEKEEKKHNREQGVFDKKRQKDTKAKSNAQIRKSGGGKI